MLRNSDQKKVYLEIAAYLRAAELNNQGDNDKSLELLQEASMLLPDSARTHYNLGVALAAAQKYDDAIEAYKKALKLDSHFPEAFNNLGTAYAALDPPDLEKAVENYKHALRLKPDYSEAFYNWGRAYDDLQNHEEAIERYREAIRLNPYYFDALNNLGIDLAIQKQYAEALTCFERARELNPEDEDVKQNLRKLREELETPR